MLQLWRGFRQTPWTILTMWLLIGVFAGTVLRSDLTGEPREQLRRAWGNVEPLTWVRDDGTRQEIIDPEFYGPLDLWDSQWWRLPLTALHHVDGLHLLLNLLGLGTIGRFLEWRWGTARTMLLSIGAMFVAILPEYLMGSYAIGYSGVLCAQAGAVGVLRQRDEWLRDRLPDAAVMWFIAGLVLMYVATVLDIVAIANLAHATGLAYGIGVTLLSEQVRRGRWWLALISPVAHLAMLPLYAAVMHPTWNGQYLWYQATRDQRPGRAVQSSTEVLERVVQRSPELASAWLALAQQQRLEPLLAWETLVRGLRTNPSNERLWAAVRTAWRRLRNGPDREPALAILTVQFPGNHPSILEQLDRTVIPPVLIAPDRPPIPTKVVAEPETPVDYEPPPDAIWPPRRPLPLERLRPGDSQESRNL